MKKYTLLIVAVVGLLIINASLVTFLLFRKPPPPMEGGRAGMGRQGPKEIIIDRLHFDKEQVAQYEALIEIHQGTIRALDDSIKDAKDDLYRTLTADNSSEKDSLIDRIGVLQRRIETTHYAHFMDIKKLCKPGQVKDFAELAQELAGYFDRGKKGPPPPRH